MNKSDEEPQPGEAADAERVNTPDRRLIGLPACAGIAIGPVFRAVEPPAQITRSKIHASDIPAELARLDAAVLQSRRQLLKLRSRLTVLPEESQGEIAPLLDAYLQMLGPSRLLRGVRQRVQERLMSAETAVMDSANEIAHAVIDRLADAHGLDRSSTQRQADEVREIGRRLVRNLTRAPFRSYSDAPSGSILVAEALRPSDAALINPAKIAGVATEEGGADGHTAIILRALGVPSVLGAPGLLQSGGAGVNAIVDGTSGIVTLLPSEASVAAARRAVAAFARERQRLGRLRRLPAVTLDGEAADLQANLELPLELPLVAQSGANGIGLLRTEFLFMNRDTIPTVDEQEASYRIVIETMAGDTVTIRALDWGGEKEIEALVAAGLVPEIQDANPALGMRGVRLLLRRRKELFETQLLAMLRAARAGPVRILLPMVSNVAEVQAARAIYRDVVTHLSEAGEPLPDPLPPLGIMIETPGAALSAEALAEEADFFAIGTNDLCMHTLAVDRAELDVAHLYDPLHPSVLRLIQMTAESARLHRLPVSVCGEMAANPSFTPLLLGLGIRSFSMTASAVPRVKQALRSTTIDDCQRLAWQVMKQFDPRRTRELLEQFGR